MRDHIAAALCVASVAIAYLFHREQVETPFWLVQNVATAWFVIGVWHGRVNLNRTHDQLVREPPKWPPLARFLIKWGIVGNLLAIWVGLSQP